MMIVTKEASLDERRTLAWLGAHNTTVPFSYSADLETEGTALTCLEYVADSTDPTAIGHDRKRKIAHALAVIHHAAFDRGKACEKALPWLPHADHSFFAERIVDGCWRGPWQQLLTGRAYTDWFGIKHPATTPDGSFGVAFAAVTPAIETVAARFIEAMQSAWETATGLTLVHTDLHGDHLRWQGGEARIIDWGQARYGPLALDLPNLLSREESLLYREALIALGHDLPLDTFLAGYDAARPYPGFKYFGIGLWNWRHGDPAQRHKNVQYWIDMVLGAGR